MSTVNRKQAAQAAEENNALRERLQRLEEEEERQNQANSTYCGDDQGDSSENPAIERYQENNAELKDSISDLVRKLTELKAVNVTELSHEYTRLNHRRAFLSNEIGALRNIVANQEGNVRRAARTVSAQQEMRQINEEHNTETKSDIKMFKERREELMKETSQLARKETQLKQELDSMPTTGEEVEEERKKVIEDNEKKDKQIEQLSAEHQALKDESGYDSDKSEETEVADLRKEYVRLKEELKQMK